MPSVLLAACAAAGALGVLAAPAAASQMIAKGVHKATLVVDRHHVARVSFTDRHGKRWHVLAWGAINARKPSRTVPQVKFKLDRNGGGTYWRTMRNHCARYDGPPLTHLVAACSEPNGTNWALQSWRRLQPNGGWPWKARDPRYFKELHLSHWRGKLPRLFIDVGFTYRVYDELFGVLKYHGHGVYGFSSARSGNPKDTYGRNVYIDVLNPRWAKGWHRFNSGLTHRPEGDFCFGMYKLYRRKKAANGDRYRATVLGPGVTPIMSDDIREPGPYDPELDKRKDKEQRHLASRRGKHSCFKTH